MSDSETSLIHPTATRFPKPAAETLRAPAKPLEPSRQNPRVHLPVWPLWLLFGGFPVFWVLGLGGFAIPIATFPMLVYLLVHREVRLPRCFNVWLLFLAWVAASAIEVNGTNRLVGAAWRMSLYFGATVVFLYVYNSSRNLLPSRRLAWMMVAFLSFVVVGGYLGVISPHGSLSTPFEHILPGSIRSNELVGALVHPPFAQVPESIYVDVAPRPAAPFPYTNWWGANFALLVPFVIVAITQTPRTGRRLLLAGLLVVAMFPALLTVNRGMVLALAVGILYAAIRFAYRGHTRALIAVVAILGVGLTLMSILHFGSRVDQRVTNSSTNQGRTAVYTETIHETLKAPLLGHGAPERPTTSGGASVALGTQGQLWTVLYAQGFPGTALFICALIALAWRTRRAPTVPLIWMHVVVVMSIVMVPVYGLQATELAIVMAAAALALRDRSPARDIVRARAGRALAPVTT